MLRIVIFDDEERIGLQLKELLEQSGDDLVVDFFQDWHALQFYFSQHAHIDAASQHTPFTVPMRATTSFPSSWKVCRSTFSSAIKVMLSICTMYSELTPRKYIFRRRSFRSVHMGTALLQKIGQSWCNVKANCINRKTYGNTAQRSPIENG